MWDLPPQLVELAKHLLSSIRDIKEGLGEQKEAITTAIRETADAKKEKSDVPPRIVAEVILPQGIEVRKSADEQTDDKNYQFKTLRIARRSLIVSILTLISLIIYAWFTHGQLVEMRKTTRAAQDASYAACVNAQIARGTLIEMRAGGTDTHNLALSSIAQAAAATRAVAAQIEIEREGLSELKIGTEIIRPFTIKNIGRTAAIQPKIVSVSEIIDVGREPVFSYPEQPKNHADTGFMSPDDKPMNYGSAVWKGDKRMVLDKADSD
jgi:hypothetical protein